jgi:hypothetical protein
MADTNVKRTAWFLALQNVMNFPRHFFAPLASRPGLYRTPAHRPDTDNSTSSRGFITTSSEMWSRRFGETMKTAWHQPSAPGVSADKLMFGIPHPVGDVYPWRGATRWMKAISSQEPLNAAKPSPVYDRKIKYSGQKLEPLNTGIRAFSVIPATTFAPQPAYRPRRETSTSPARPNRPDPLADGSPNPGDWATTRSGFLTTANSPIVETMDPRSDFSAQSKQPFADTSDDPGEHPTRPGQTSVSTLHIDGSALGRWAIQHLGRALGKPAAGMTSVDPRASVARSRVAPF